MPHFEHIKCYKKIFAFAKAMPPKWRMEKLHFFYKGENLNIASAKTLCIGPLGTIQRV
jgi:hypothetical protein